MSLDVFSGSGDRGDIDEASVTVVGAGVGGLAAAAYLADGGADVRVLEQHDRPGGHANRFVEDGYAFDTGPFRPNHRSDAVEGLYYTGVYTRPGSVCRCISSAASTPPRRSSRTAEPPVATPRTDARPGPRPAAASR